MGGGDRLREEEEDKEESGEVWKRISSCLVNGGWMWVIVVDFTYWLKSTLFPPCSIYTVG